MNSSRKSIIAGYVCQDEGGGSGLASCAGTVANGSAIDTSPGGGKSFTLNAADHAGNQASTSASYSVVYYFSCFSSPSYPGSAMENQRSHASTIQTRIKNAAPQLNEGRHHLSDKGLLKTLLGYKSGRQKYLPLRKISPPPVFLAPDVPASGLVRVPRRIRFAAA